MKVLIASSEAVPFIKTGGLGDVIGALAGEFKKAGVRSAVILPLYRTIKKAAKTLGIRSLNKTISVPVGKKIEKGRLWKCAPPEGTVSYFIDNDKFFDRDELYSTAEGEFSDNASRFTFYCRGVLEALKTLKFDADIIHCNDWHTGLIPVYLKTIYRHTFPHMASLMTIHNMGYQGIFGASSLSLTGIEHDEFAEHTLVHNGKFNFLRAGILFSDAITTVSKQYAKEITTPEYGFGLDNVLRARNRDIFGIINGVDYDNWNPAKDSSIPARYSLKELSGKAMCKRYLQESCGLPFSRSMLIGMVSRFSSQKGLDLAAESMEDIIGSGMQVAILGKGDESYHKIFLGLQKKFGPGLSVTIGFDNDLAHKIYAGADVYLMPSQYEPCGLGQIIAMRYGTIPVARKTGGILDTVSEYAPSNGKGTGFLFNSYSSDKLLTTIKKANRFYKDKQHWRVIQKNAMSRDFSWRRSAEKYLALYKKTVKMKN